jgi:hypothetical protein
MVMMMMMMMMARCQCCARQCLHIVIQSTSTGCHQADKYAAVRPQRWISISIPLRCCSSVAKPHKKAFEKFQFYLVYSFSADLMLGSAVAFFGRGRGGGDGGDGGGGLLTYSHLDELHQVYLPMHSNMCPELKHATISRFIEEHAVTSRPAAAGASSCLAPNTYKLSASAWQHAHSLLAHTTLHHGSSLLSMARSQYEACPPRDKQPFEELLRGFSAHAAAPSSSPTPSLPPPSSSSSPSLQCYLPNEALQLLKTSCVDLWLLMQVTRHLHLYCLNMFIPLAFSSRTSDDLGHVTVCFLQVANMNPGRCPHAAYLANFPLNSSIRL